MNWNDLAFWNAVQYMLTAMLGMVVVRVLAQLAPETVRKAKDTWREIRGHTVELIAAFDQPSDPIVRLLAALGVPADKTVLVAPRVLRALADAIDEATGRNVPKMDNIGNTAPSTRPGDYEGMGTEQSSDV